MAYCTVDEVNESLPLDNQVDDQTFPTWATVESILPKLDSILNVAFVTGGGTLPVTDDDILNWFNVLESGKAAFTVMQLRGAAKDKESLWQKFSDDWDAAIIKLSDKEQAIIPPDTTGPTTGSPSSFRDQEPQLTRDKIY